MTARDNLALCAMQVMLKHEWKTRISLCNRVRRFFGLSYKTYVSCDPNRLAHNSYVIADAMLEASEKQQSHEQPQE